MKNSDNDTVLDMVKNIRWMLIFIYLSLMFFTLCSEWAIVGHTKDLSNQVSTLQAQVQQK